MARRGLRGLAKAYSLFASSLSFIQVLIYLPLSLEVAGKSCFLSLSAALAGYYFLQSTLDLLLRSTRLHRLSRILSPIQVLAVPALLLVSLNLYHAPPTSAQKYGYILTSVPGAWEAILKALTPLFTLLEGVSTLLVIQALGQVSKYLIEERSESYQFIFLISSAATYVASAFFLYDSYKFAAATPHSATLIGVSLTSVIFLTGIAFALRKGNVVETSLMLAYLAFQIFYLSEGPNPIVYLGSLSQSSPPQIIQSISTIISFFSHIFGASLDFLIAAWGALPLPVIVGLAYRIAILYAAGQVLVALKRSQTGFDEYETALSDERGAGPRGMTLIVCYSRFILVSVYTHLLLINFAGAHQFWSWLNIAITLSLWAVELLLSKGENEANVVRGFRFKSD